MASIESMGSSSTTFITINGQKMTLAEAKKWKKKAQAEIESKLSKKKQCELRKKRRESKKKRETEITVLPKIIKGIIKNAGPIKSLSAYYDNAYRQWGTIANMILGLPEIKGPFVMFRADARDIVSTISEISEIAKGNEKAVFAYVQKLSWKLDNTKAKMKALYNGVIESGVLFQMKDKECINGEGRRLGLRILMTRTFKSLNAIEAAIEELNGIASEGLGDFEYRVDKLERAYRTI